MRGDAEDPPEADVTVFLLNEVIVKEPFWTTVDIVRFANRHDHCVISSHYINSQFETVRFCLDVSMLTGGHGGANVAHHCRTRLLMRKFDINQWLGSTTDTASSMGTAFKRAGAVRLVEDTGTNNNDSMRGVDDLYEKKSVKLEDGNDSKKYELDSSLEMNEVEEFVEFAFQLPDDPAIDGMHVAIWGASLSTTFCATRTLCHW